MKAIISVSNKTGVVELARGLAELKFEVYSTGGTHKALDEAGVAVGSVEGRRPKEALAKQLAQVVADGRREFALGPEVRDYRICESLYVLRSDALVCATRVAPSP